MKHMISEKRKINVVNFFMIMFYLALIGSSIQLGMAIANGPIGVEPSISSTNPDYRVSDSPYLQLPDDMKGWPPISSPSKPSGEVSADPNVVQIYNVSTGIVTEISSKAETSVSNSSEPYRGLLESTD
jgi:hypothetical protein